VLKEAIAVFLYCLMMQRQAIWNIKTITKTPTVKGLKQSLSSKPTQRPQLPKNTIVNVIEPMTKNATPRETGFSVNSWILNWEFLIWSLSIPLSAQLALKFVTGLAQILGVTFVLFKTDVVLTLYV